MKKIILALSLIALLVGCSGEKAANQSINTDAMDRTVTGIQEAKGYGGISEIEIRKFTYNGQKAIQNRELNKLVIFEEGQDIKRLLIHSISRLRTPALLIDWRLIIRWIL